MVGIFHAQFAQSLGYFELDQRINLLDNPNWYLYPIRRGLRLCEEKFCNEKNEKKLYQNNNLTKIQKKNLKFRLHGEVKSKNRTNLSPPIYFRLKFCQLRIEQLQKKIYG